MRTILLAFLMGLGVISIVKAQPFQRYKRDLKDIAESAVLYAAGEISERVKAPIGGENNFEMQAGGKELDFNYGMQVKDQFSRRRRSIRQIGLNIDHEVSDSNIIKNPHGKYRRSPCGQKSTTQKPNDENAEE